MFLLYPLYTEDDLQRRVKTLCKMTEQWCTLVSVSSRFCLGLSRGTSIHQNMFIIMNVSERYPTYSKYSSVAY